MFALFYILPVNLTRCYVVAGIEVRGNKGEAWCLLSDIGEEAVLCRGHAEAAPCCDRAEALSEGAEGGARGREAGNAVWYGPLSAGKAFSLWVSSFEGKLCTTTAQLSYDLIVRYMMDSPKQALRRASLLQSILCMLCLAVAVTRPG